jgi:hypothetical protein
MKNGWKITYLVVCGTMKYDRNTAPTKRVKYDEKQPFPTGLISPGNLLGISILLNFLMFYKKLSIQTSNEKLDVLTCKKRTLQRVKNIFSGRETNQ